MEWYGPLAILPAIALLILSTATFVIALNDEITVLVKDKEKYAEIIHLKMIQLNRLGIANAFLYACALLFMIAGLSMAFTNNNNLFLYLMIGGLITGVVALSFLFLHSLRSILIRKKHLKI
jgi:hypothetical protein